MFLGIENPLNFPQLLYILHTSLKQERKNISVVYTIF